MTDTTAHPTANQAADSTADTRSGANADLRHRLDQLARFVRGAPSLADSLRWWLGFRLDTRPATPSTPSRAVDVDDGDAQLLDIPLGTRVRHRELELVSAVAPALLVATVTELLYAPPLGRLDRATRHALDNGTSLVEAAVTPVQRAVCVIQRGHLDNPEPDAVALQAHTVLSVAGRPVALTTERVYWPVITHRTHQAAAPAHLLSGTR